MKIIDLLLEEDAQRYYTGKPLETGGTSIAGDVAPAIKLLFGTHIKTDNVVLDYGAGKYARNANWLRGQGVIKVFAYDPFNHNGGEGWKDGEVASKLPSEKFDVAFTCFVLNVVPKYVEDKIIADVKKRANKVFHVTRNKDIFDTVKNALIKRDRYVYPFFVKEFNNGQEVEDVKQLPDELIMDFCKFGVQTSRGFQRIPELEKSGFRLIKNTSGYKIYER